MSILSQLPRLFAVGISLLVGASVWAEESPRAARSVHLGYPSPPASMFYNEMTITASSPGSYFMAAGWNTGYFGLQELGNGKKVILFSVWDPTSGDDPKAVKAEDRVELLYQAEDVRIRRFGGEGTGGQCMADFDWQLGKAVRFLVAAKVEGEKTAYSGFVLSEGDKDWKQLVTFRTRTGGKPLSGLYSFVEDFRRDGKSVNEVRRAQFGNAWARDLEGKWTALTKANFTASSSKTEAQETIDAGLSGVDFFLTTGGTTKRTKELNQLLPERTPLPDTAAPAVPKDWK